MTKKFTHMGVFKLAPESRIILREQEQFWVAPNGVSWEKGTPVLDVNEMVPRSMNGREKD